MSEDSRSSPTTEAEACLRQVQALLKLYQYLQTTLPATDGRLAWVFAQYTDALEKSNNLSPIEAVTPPDPLRAKRIADLLADLERDRKAGATADSLIQTAANLINEFH